MTITPLHGHCRPPVHATHTDRLSVTALARGRRICVTVRGEVDAANAKDFAVAVCEAIGSSQARYRMVEVDLRALGFLAVDGIAALHAINAQLARRDVAWSVLPSPVVSRLLALCDPEGVIPRADDTEPSEAEPA